MAYTAVLPMSATNSGGVTCDVGAKVRLLVLIGSVGTAITALSVADGGDRREIAGSTIGAVMSALATAALVTLVRHRLHPPGSAPRTASTWLAAAGSIVGVVIAMIVPRSSLDPLILGGGTGGLVALFYWSMHLAEKPSS